MKTNEPFDNSHAVSLRKQFMEKFGIEEIPPSIPDLEIIEGRFESKPANFKRIKKDFQNFIKMTKAGSIEGISITWKEGCLNKFKACIMGPRDTPFEKGEFYLKIICDKDYPWKPPNIKFITSIFHPNISRDGTICLDLLKDEWSPVMTFATVLISIQSLLQNPNAEDPLRPKIAKLFIENRKLWERIAKIWVLKHARVLRYGISNELPEYIPIYYQIFPNEIKPDW